MKFSKKIFLGIAIFLVVLSIPAFIFYKNNYVSNKKFKDVVNVTEESFEFDKSKLDYSENIKVRDKKEVYEDIHRMANTKIVADKVWGKEEITEEKLNKIILEVMKSDFSDKDHLLELLHNWKKGDFSNCVSEHNYVWGKLGGTVGKATGLKPGVE